MDRSCLEYTIEEQEAIIDKLTIENRELKGLLCRIYSASGGLQKWDPRPVSDQAFKDIVDRADTFNEVLRMYTLCLFKTDNPMFFIESPDCIYIKRHSHTEIITSNVLTTFVMEELEKHASQYYGEPLVLDNPQGLEDTVMSSLQQIISEYTKLVDTSLLITDYSPLTTTHTFKVPVIPSRYHTVSDTPGSKGYLAGVALRSGAKCFPDIPVIK